MTGLPNRKTRVGDLRPSQLLHSFGIGALVDLPRLSALVMGLDDWEVAYATEIGEDRLLAAVRGRLGASVKRFLAPPLPPETDAPTFNPYDTQTLIGVPVMPFPQWLQCPWCHLLAPIDSGLFELKADRFAADRTRYVHVNCIKPGAPPNALPSRYLVACPNGHLDDLPWEIFVHKGPTDCKAVLRVIEPRIPVEATNVTIECETCKRTRNLTEAFGPDGRYNLPPCRGRRPHLRDSDPQGCNQPLRAILLGASNTWFPVTMSALSIPAAMNTKLQQLVDGAWTILKEVSSSDELPILRKIGQLPSLAAYSDEEIWEAVEANRSANETLQAETISLRGPEWNVLSRREPQSQGDDFRLTPVEPPTGLRHLIDQVVLVERLREVRALVGFTRIESPGDLADTDDFPIDRIAPLTRKPPQWVPASEVRGEGIFIQFLESALRTWEESKEVREWESTFFLAYRAWASKLNIPNPAAFPGIRYILLHTFSHALMRQLVLECGYTAASISERIYARPPEADDGPMAGVLIYTAAPDSEGTLGGLVSLGEPEKLGRHIRGALDSVRICASDPLCSEHHPLYHSATLHGAACHGCLFVPETACERGNKYLDRSLLIATMTTAARAFMPES